MSSPPREGGAALWVGRAVVGSVRLAARLVPPRLRRAVEDRIFYGVFHTTRVTNDSYGWRPEEPPGYTPEAHSKRGS